MKEMLRILFLSANPKGTTPLRLDEEAREIESGLRRSSLRANFEFRSQWAVRPRDIRRAFLDYEADVVHFSGHGIGEGGLVFEDDTGKLAVVPTEALAELFELVCDRVQCVVLNACYSEAQANAIARHVNFVIGMQWQVGDRAAIEFSVGFYDALAAGYLVAKAFRFGRNAIQLAGLNEHTTPVLIMKDHSGRPWLAEKPRDPDKPAFGKSPVRGEVVRSESKLKVAGIEEVVQWGWDGTKLLEALIALDYETTDGLTSVHEGSPAQWGPVFMNHPETWRLITTGPRAIVGYWHWAPLFRREYELAKAGQLNDSQITVDTVQYFELPGVYDLYFVQICILAEHRRPHSFQLLLNTVLDVLDELSEGDVLVREVAANAYTPAGEALCKGFNMQLVCQHRDHGKIYTAPARDLLRHPLALRRVALQRKYKSAQLLENRPA